MQKINKANFLCQSNINVQRSKQCKRQNRQFNQKCGQKKHIRCHCNCNTNGAGKSDEI